MDPVPLFFPGRHIPSVFQKRGYHRLPVKGGWVEIPKKRVLEVCWEFLFELNGGFFKIVTSLNTFDETAGFSCHLRSLEIASSGNIYVTTLNEPQQLLFCTPWSSIKPCLSHHFIPLNHGSLGITIKFHYTTILPWLSNEFSHQKSHHRDDGSRINHLHLPMERVATINGKLFNGHSRNPNWRNLPYIYMYI